MQHGRFPAVGIALVACAMALAGCSRGEAERVVVTGSSTMAPLLQELGARYERESGVRVDVHSGGSGRGLEDVRRGVADLGMVSREPGPSEGDLEAHGIGRDGIAVIVHAANPATALDEADLIALYRGRRQRWSELLDFEAPVVVIHKAAGRGTQTLFLEYLELADAEIEAQMIAGENQEVIRLVAGNRGAIGYVSIGPARDAASAGTPIELLALDGVPPTVEALRDGRYPLSRQLTLVSREPLSGGAAELVALARSEEASELYERYGFIQPTP